MAIGRSTRRTRALSLTGIAGVTVIVAGSIVTALTYTGRFGQSYSFLNHFISELGESGVSDLSWIFNGALIAGGLLIVVFLFSIPASIKGPVRYPFFITSFGAGISATLVGLFPMNYHVPHIIAAMTFFYTGMISTVLFSGIALFSKRSIYPKWLAIPGMLSAALFFALIFFTEPSSGMETQVQGLARFSSERPDVLPSPFLEWLAVFTILLWIVLVAAYQFHRNRKSEPDE